MDYYGGGDDILRAHTGSGGMTSSLSVGTKGPASIRRLLQFPLSPYINNGQSNVRSAPPLDPRFANTVVSREQMAAIVDSQWLSRSRPVKTREEISMLKEV